MTIITTLARAVTALLIFSAGAAVVLGLTQYLITSQHLGEAHALKAWTIAGGIVAGGAFLPFMHGKARVLLVLGILSAEAFNIGMITETTWRERAAAHAERQQAHARDLEAYQGRVKARDDAETRLARAEAAAEQKEQARAADASKRDCKRECMAGHLEAVTAARAEVTAARTALAAAPLPGVPPSLDADSGAGQPPLGQYWDLAMAVLSSIGGNLIAIGLFAFAGTVASRQPATGNRQGLPAACPLPAATLPTITVADVSAADAVLLQQANERALAAFRQSLSAHRDLDVFRSLLSERLPDRHGPTVAERLPESFPPPESGPPKPGKRGPRPSQLPENVVDLRPATHPVIAALENVGGSVASNRDLAALMGVSDGEATKRRGEVAHLLIEEQQGKQRRIALRG